jgi:RNA polymerase sigma-70 factor (ECF subfamily)
MPYMGHGYSIEEHMSTVTLSNVNHGPLTEELDRIFREHHQLVYRTALGVTGSREDAQDVVQTIFLRLLRRECPPDLKSNPKGYLYRSAVNASLNLIRTRRRHVPIEESKGLDAMAVSWECEAAEELHRRLYAAIAELSSEVAHILVLRYVHSYSIAEIAKLLGKSRGVVAVQLFRTRARLKRLISAPEEGKP